MLQFIIKFSFLFISLIILKAFKLMQIIASLFISEKIPVKLLTLESFELFIFKYFNLEQPLKILSKFSVF